MKDIDKTKEEEYKNNIEIMCKEFRKQLHKTGKASKWYQQWTTTRNLLLEHFDNDFKPDESSKSIFEETLATSGTAPLINLIWDELELWRNEEILLTVSA